MTGLLYLNKLPVLGEVTSNNVHHRPSLTWIITEWTTATRYLRCHCGQGGASFRSQLPAERFGVVPGEGGKADGRAAGDPLDVAGDSGHAAVADPLEQADHALGRCRLHAAFERPRGPGVVAQVLEAEVTAGRRREDPRDLGVAEGLRARQHQLLHKTSFLCTCEVELQARAPLDSQECPPQTESDGN